MHSHKTFLISFLLAAIVFNNIALAANDPGVKAVLDKIEIVPGASLGDIKLNATEADLLALGFTRDSLRLAKDYTYFVKPPFLTRVKGNSVVEIWLEHIGSLRNRLVYNGQTLPRELSESSIRQFFLGCQRKDESGGYELYCNHAEIRVSYSYGTKDWSLGVLSDGKMMLNSEAP